VSANHVRDFALRPPVPDPGLVQARLLEDGCPARVVPVLPDVGIEHHFGQAAVALDVGAVQPFEDLVVIAAEAVNLGDLEGRVALVLLDEPG